MTNAKRDQATREDILLLLSDEETARVSTSEDRPKLADGAEYIDLERLDLGVQRAAAAKSIVMGHILPRSAVAAGTWKKILARLSG
jgi:hypothetical protein